MKNLEKIASRIEAELEEKDQVREVALRSSRTIVRLSGGIVRGLHKSTEQRPDLQELKDEVSRLRSLLSEHPELESTGYVEGAFQEYAEACLVISLLKKGDVPPPEEIGVNSIPYLLGLGDSVGELRRFCLSELKAGDIAKANHFLDMMEDIFAALMRFDYPEAIIPIRKKQDMARSVLEKTRGEVAVSASARSLQDRLEEALKRK